MEEENWSMRIVLKGVWRRTPAGALVPAQLQFNQAGLRNQGWAEILYFRVIWLILYSSVLSKQYRDMFSPRAMLFAGQSTDNRKVSVHQDFQMKLQPNFSQAPSFETWRKLLWLEKWPWNMFFKPIFSWQNEISLSKIEAMTERNWEIIGRVGFKYSANLIFQHS